MSKRNAIIALTAAALFAPVALAQNAEKPAATAPAAAQPAKVATLKVGDKAPDLAVSTWVKGEPITGFEKGKVYVVEFWATWCPPCIASMPHLSSLQKQYKDKGVTIVGMTTGTTSPKNTLEGVQAMTKDKGDTMGYTVAFDDGKKTNEAYMKAAQQPGIPTSFVVDKDSKIAWIGHPMHLDGVLEHVVAGTWDDAARAKFQSDLEAKNKKSMQAGQAAAKDTAALKELLSGGDATAIAAAGPKFIEKLGADPMSMNMLAWSIVDPAGKLAASAKTNPALLDVAFQAAQKAETASGGKDGAILDTLARVYFVKGDKAKAIEIQKKAVAHADETMKAELEASLKEFESAK